MAKQTHNDGQLEAKKECMNIATQTERVWKFVLFSNEEIIS